MTLKEIAINNLRRRKGRTLFLLITFLVVVGTTVALNAISLGIRQELARKLESYGANIVISPKSEHLALSYGGLAVSGVTYNVQTLSSSLPEKLKQVNRPQDITAVAPKVIGSVNGSKQQYLLVGVDFPTELKIKSWWKVQGALPGPDEVVIGSGLAMRDKLGPGEKLRLGGRELKISGVLEETGGSEDRLVFSSIDLARQLTGLGDSYSIVEVNAKNPESLAAEISNLLPEAQVTPVTQLVQGAVQSAATFARFAISVSILLGLVGALVVIITLAGNVNDRTREFGIFRAIGFRQKHVLTILFSEVLIVSVAGGLGGYLIGITAPVVLGPLIRTAPLVQQGAAKAAIAQPQAMAFAWYPWLGLAAILTACVIGLLAIAYPAWKAVKLDPSEALRFI